MTRSRRRSSNSTSSMVEIPQTAYANACASRLFDSPSNKRTISFSQSSGDGSKQILPHAHNAPAQPALETLLLRFSSLFSVVFSIAARSAQAEINVWNASDSPCTGDPTTPTAQAAWVKATPSKESDSFAMRSSKFSKYVSGNFAFNVAEDQHMFAHWYAENVSITASL